LRILNLYDKMLPNMKTPVLHHHQQTLAGLLTGRAVLTRHKSK